MKTNKFIQHVVFDHYEKLRWYFISTETGNMFFISLNIFDIKYLKYGIYFLIPPLKKSHIKLNW